MSVPHEEFEVIAHLDQTFRTATTATAQAIEMMLRRSAERDRAAAQDLRAAAWADRQPRGSQGPRGSRGPVEYLTEEPSRVRTPQEREQLDQARVWLQGHDPAMAKAYERGFKRVGPFGKDTDRLEDLMLERARWGAQMEGGELGAAAPEGNLRHKMMDAVTFEYQQVVMPEGDANPDRGYAPTKAQTLAEMEHRERAWTVAREAAVAPEGRVQRELLAAWNAMTDSDRQDRFWAVYDSEPVRHVTVQIPLDAEGQPLVKRTEVTPAEAVANAVSDAKANLSAAEQERQEVIVAAKEMAALPSSGQTSRFLKEWAPRRSAAMEWDIEVTESTHARESVEHDFQSEVRDMAIMEGVGYGARPGERPTWFATLQSHDGDFQEQTVAIPAGDANVDRGSAPSQAQTLAEGAHRQEAWRIAKRTMPGEPDGWYRLSQAGREARFWDAYDAVETVPVSVPVDADGQPVLSREQIASEAVWAATEAARNTPTPTPNVNGADVTTPAAAAQEQEQRQRASSRAVSDAAPELRSMVIPAYRDNHDRGVAPSKAATPEEAQHRRQAWRIAQERWASTQPAGKGTQAAWNALDYKAKTDMYWKAYDTEQARSIGGGKVERGMSPSKASTPGEKEHRTKAWAMANARFASEHPELTPREAERAFKQLDWQDTALYYWPAYDDPASQPTNRNSTPSDTVSPQPAASPSSDASPAEPTDRQGPDRVTDDTVELPALSDADEPFDPYGDDARYGSDEPTVVLDAGDVQQQASRERSEDQQVVGQAEHVVADAVAVGAVAGIVGEEITQHGAEHGTGQETSRDRVVELNTAAAEFFRDQATPDSKGGSYLRERLGADVVNNARWQLGYAPEGWTNLTAHLRRTQAATDRELLDSGLGRESSRGTVIDTFRDRAMIGVRDVNGDTVGFVGRDLSGAPNAPKYTNTGHTPAYTKGEHLLGLHEAPQGAQLWRVEGPMDAIALTAAGDGKAAGIAPLGTALSNRQAELLVEHSGGKVWAALDNDAAGQKALVKDFDALGARGIDVRAVTLPGSDPAEIWQRDPDLLRRTVAAAEVWPNAGTMVLEAWAEEHREGLAAGLDSDIRAYHAKVDDVMSKVPSDEHGTVGLEAQAVLNSITHPRSTDTSTAELDSLSSSSSERSRNADSAENAESADIVPDAMTEAGSRTLGAYDRAAESRLDQVQDPEAVEARRVSGHGFSRSTTDMLQTRKDAPHVDLAPPSSALRQAQQQTIQRSHRMR